jgi:hypothetical protein
VSVARPATAGVAPGGTCGAGGQPLGAGEAAAPAERAALASTAAAPNRAAAARPRRAHGAGAGAGDKDSAEPSFQSFRQFGSRYSSSKAIDFRASEALLKKVFMLRALSSGLTSVATQRARQNLYKCYLAQRKEGDAAELKKDVEL